MHGTLEKTFDGQYRVMCPDGYISSRGGFCQKLSEAMRFRGAGFAIRYAQIHGIAITRWWF